MDGADVKQEGLCVVLMLIKVCVVLMLREGCEVLMLRECGWR